MEEKIVYIEILNKELRCYDSQLKVFIRHGESEHFSSCTYKVTFFKAHGGQMKILGRIIQDKSPEVINKVKISKKSELIIELSYMQILELEYKFSDTTKVYKVVID